MRLIAALWVMAVAVTSAQAPARDPGAGIAVPTGTAGISGVVTDEQSQPVRRAVVSLVGDMRVNISTMTADDGRFAFMNLPAGRFTIKAEKPAFPSTSYGAKMPNRPGAGVLLTEGQQVAGLSLKLAHGGVLAGTVYDERGQPMPGVGIMAWEVRTSLPGERTINSPISGGEWVNTDDQGRYRIFGLPPGEYTVGTYWAFGAGQLAVRVPSDDEIRAAFLAATQPSPDGPGNAAFSAPPPPPKTYAYSPVYYPGSVDPMAASTVQLAAGEERLGLDLRMQFVPMTRLEALVTGPQGPVSGARMEFLRKSRVAGMGVTSVSSSGPDGRYAVNGVAAGDYTLRALTQKIPGSPAMFALADLSVGGTEPIAMTLQLEPAITVAGRFAFEGTALPPPADLTRLNVSLFPATNESPSTNEPAVIEASGSFSLGGILPGTYRVTSGVPNPAGPTSTAPRWVLKTVSNSGQDITDLPLQIRPGDAPSLVVTFTDQVSDLSGTITDAAGKPAPDYFIVVIPADEQMWLILTRRIASTRPDAQGRFIFRNLPPGNYRIAATTDLVQRDLQDVATIKVLAAQSTPVTLGLGEKKAFDLKVGGQ